MRLWKDNKLDEPWSKPDEEIAELFWLSHWAKLALECWRLERALRAFITDSDGLSSAFEEEDYEATHEAVRKAWPSEEELKLDTFNGKGPRK